VAAALAVMGSTVLSSMVSICFAFFLCFLGNVVEGMRAIAATLSKPGTALMDLTPGITRMTAESAPLWVRTVNQTIRYLLNGLSVVVPDFAKFYASSSLREGVSVPSEFVVGSVRSVTGSMWPEVHLGAVCYFLIYGGGALLLGWLLFRRREMA